MHLAITTTSSLYFKHLPSSQNKLLLLYEPQDPLQLSNNKNKGRISSTCPSSAKRLYQVIGGGGEYAMEKERKEGKKTLLQDPTTIHHVYCVALNTLHAKANRKEQNNTEKDTQTPL